MRRKSLGGCANSSGYARDRFFPSCLGPAGRTPTFVRLIVVGTGPFAVPTHEGLTKSRHESDLVVTRPPAGRAATASAIKLTGESLGLTVWSPPTVNSPESQTR